MSVDFGLFAKLIVDAVNPPKPKQETYQDMITTPVETGLGVKMDVATILSVILSVALGVIAFILSWTCNTALDYHVVIKAFFGTFAFLFGFTYIVLYMLLRWDSCTRVMYGARR